MRYVESSTFFCAKTETFKDRALDTLDMRNTAKPHPLESLVDTNLPQTSQTEAALALAAENNW